MNSFDIVESSFSSLNNSFKGWLIPSQIAQGFRLGPLLFVKLWFQDYWSAAKCWNKLLRIFEENDAEDVVFDNHSDRDDWRGDKVCRLVPRQRRDNAPPAPRRHLIIDPRASAKHITSCKSQPSFFFVQLNRWVQGNAPQQWMAWKAGTPTQKEISSPKFYLFTPTASVFFYPFSLFSIRFFPPSLSIKIDWLRYCNTMKYFSPLSFYMHSTRSFQPVVLTCELWLNSWYELRSLPIVDIIRRAKAQEQTVKMYKKGKEKQGSVKSMEPWSSHCNRNSANRIKCCYCAKRNRCK